MLGMISADGKYIYCHLDKQGNEIGHVDARLGSMAHEQQIEHQELMMRSAYDVTQSS